MGDTRTPAPAPNSPVSYGWCAWHGGVAENVRLIDVIEQGSGSGGTQFACPTCRQVHHLIPFADR